MTTAKELLKAFDEKFVIAHLTHKDEIARLAWCPRKLQPFLFRHKKLLGIWLLLFTRNR